MEPNVASRVSDPLHKKVSAVGAECGQLQHKIRSRSGMRSSVLACLLVFVLGRMPPSLRSTEERVHDVAALAAELMKGMQQQPPQPAATICLDAAASTAQAPCPIPHPPTQYTFPSRLSQLSPLAYCGRVVAAAQQLPNPSPDSFNEVARALLRETCQQPAARPITVHQAQLRGQYYPFMARQPMSEELSSTLILSLQNVNRYNDVMRLRSMFHVLQHQGTVPFLAAVVDAYAFGFSSPGDAVRIPAPKQVEAQRLFELLRATEKRFFLDTNVRHADASKLAASDRIVQHCQIENPILFAVMRCWSYAIEVSQCNSPFMSLSVFIDA